MANAPSAATAVLCILDGWGQSEERSGNAVALARTPVYDSLLKRWPHTSLAASQSDVGLPDGQFGNSEVGHMNLGAGRIVLQDVLRIDAALDGRGFSAEPALQRYLTALKGRPSAVSHVFGLISPGGVHGKQRHVAALARALAKEGAKVAIHAILDGRDTPPLSALGYMERFLQEISDCPNARLATVGGRYYAMDRDRRWERVRKYWEACVPARGRRVATALGAIKASYGLSVADEFALPTVIGDYEGMKDGDGVVMSNFRADRVRQLLTSIVDPEFGGFARPGAPRLAAALGMTEYSLRLNRFLDAMFPPQTPRETLGEVVASHGLKQVRIAETEKYAHVTFFFNGRVETRFAGEERRLSTSPRVATYDACPAMAAPAVARHTVRAILGDEGRLLVVNFANPDMVGHTGSLPATVKAVETVDSCLGVVLDAALAQGAKLVVTADHGNAECMVQPESGLPHTAHTMNPVPFIVVNAGARARLADGGRLADVAPTLLALMGLPQPSAMSGRSLLVAAAGRRRQGVGA